jgi:predicted nucleic acid-binding protein
MGDRTVKIYLDTSAYNRPFDDQTQPKIFLESQAVAIILQMAGLRQKVNEAIGQRAEQLEHNGVKAVDALHVACAEAVGSDYFLTCDKRLINRCSTLTMKVMNPVDFVLEVTNDDSSRE